MNDSRSVLAILASTTLVLAFAGQAVAVSVDGSITGDDYGTPLAVQTVQTGFGDNNGLDKGSELNAAYARVEAGRLYVTLTGNLEDNFNKLVVFFDSREGGQNVLDTDTFDGGTNPVVDPSPFGGDPGLFAKMNSFFGGATTFDSGFAADYVMVLRNGFTGSENRFDVDFAELAGDASQYLGVFDPTSENSGETGLGVNQYAIDLGFDNSNTAGVGGGNGAADQTEAAAVTTGVEFGVALADLGTTLGGGEIRITAFINNSNHDYASNQFLGGLPAGTDNLGSDSLGNYFQHETFFDLNDFAGEQFFTVPLLEASGVPGDYNNDGVVNAADYTVARDNFGAPAGALPNDDSGLTIGETQLTTWQANYGLSIDDLSFTVPEPASVLLLVLAFASSSARQRT